MKKKILSLLLALTGVTASADVVYTYDFMTDTPTSWAGLTTTEKTTVNGLTFVNCKRYTTSGNYYVMLNKGGNASITLPEYDTPVKSIFIYNNSGAAAAASYRLYINDVADGDARTFPAVSKDSYLAWTYNDQAAGATYKIAQTSTSKNGQLTKIVVTCTDPATTPVTVAAPTIGFNTETATVTLDCTDSEAKLYYTLNGDEPTNESTLYEAPFTVTEDCTVKAVAYVGAEASNVVSYSVVLPKTYTIAKLIEAAPAATETFTLAGPLTAAYRSGAYMYVTDSANDWMLIYDSKAPEVTNGSTFTHIEGNYKPYNKLPEVVPTSYGTMTQGTAVEPATVTISEVTAALLNHYVRIEGVTLSDISGKNAKLTDANNNTLNIYQNFTDVTLEEGEGFTVEGFVGCYNATIQISVSAISGGVVMETVETPVILPEDAELTEGAEITITTATEGATIRYTVDGTEPTAESAVYTGAITFTGATMTVKAFATKEGMLDSEVATAVYALYNADAPQKLTFDFVNETYGMTRLSGTTSEYNPNPCTFSSGVVTATLTGASNSRLWSDGLRFYKGCESFTVSVPAGFEIVSVTPTYKTATQTSILTKKDDESTATSWVYTTSVASGNVAVKSIDVTYSLTDEVELAALIDGQPAPAYFKYEEGATVTLTAPKGATISYRFTVTKPIEAYALVDDEWIEATSNPYVLALTEEMEGHTLEVKSTANPDKVATIKITDGSTTSVSELNAESAPAEAYDLMGRRVANPTRGLYIIAGKKLIK